jgi:pimeloyl-ACP methyl ester carboxylesterase
MIVKMKIQILITICFCWTQIALSQTAENNSVIIDKVKVSYRTFRLGTRKGNEPIIVFENGIGGGGFNQIYQYLPTNAACIEYDRNGLGQSEIDTAIKNDNQVVERLHKLLTTVNIKAPYLLVGHSIGGPYIRLFASKYPSEVSGLVFIDPTDYMLTKKEDEYAKKVSKSLTGYRDIWTINLKTMANDTSMPIGVRNEVKREFYASTPTFFKEYQQLEPLKDIPVTVIISYAKPVEPYEIEMNKKLKLGINITPWWKEFDNFRIQHYIDLIRNNHKSKIILLPNYSHGVHYQDPELVGKAVAETYNHCMEKIEK